MNSNRIEDTEDTEDTEGTKFVRQLKAGTEFTLAGLKKPTTFRVIDSELIMKLPIKPPIPINDFIAFQDGRYHAEDFEAYKPEEIIIQIPS